MHMGSRTVGNKPKRGQCLHNLVREGDRFDTFRYILPLLLVWSYSYTNSNCYLQFYKYGVSRNSKSNNNVKFKT